MIKDKKVLAVIPILKLSLAQQVLDEVSLLQWTIIESAKSEYIDIVVVVSNQDLQQIVQPYSKEISDKIVYVNIPQDSQNDQIQICKKINDNVQADYIVFLDPQYPIRNNNLINQSIQQMFSNNCQTLISVKKQQPLYWNFTDKQANSIYDIENKIQFYPDEQCLYKQTGSVLITQKQVLLKNSKFGNNIFLFCVDLIQSFSAKTQDQLMILNSIVKGKGMI